MITVEHLAAKVLGLFIHQVSESLSLRPNKPVVADLSINICLNTLNLYICFQAVLATALCLWYGIW